MICWDYWTVWLLNVEPVDPLSLLNCWAYDLSSLLNSPVELLSLWNCWSCWTVKPVELFSLLYSWACLTVEPAELLSLLISWACKTLESCDLLSLLTAEPSELLNFLNCESAKLLSQLHCPGYWKVPRQAVSRSTTTLASWRSSPSARCLPPLDLQFIHVHIVNHGLGH